MYTIFESLNKLNIKIGIFSAICTSLTSLSIYNRTIPIPEIYIKSIISTEDDKNAPIDPRFIVKLKNMGGCNMVIDKIYITQKNTIFNSFGEIILKNNKINQLKYKISTELKNSSISLGKNKSINIVTFRPNINNAFINSKIKNNIPYGKEWEDDLTNDLKDIKIIIHYSYFNIPFINNMIFSKIKIYNL